MAVSYKSYYDLDRLGFKVGMRVKVICQSCYKHYDLVDRIGTVDPNYGFGKVPVRFENLRNDGASCGIFYIPASDLVIVKDNNIMEENNMSNITNVTNYLNAVKIRFLDDQFDCKYVYANFDAEIKVGDLVVVKPAHHEMALARVVEVIDKNDFETTREVVARVDTYMYDDRVANRAKAAELKAKMQERAKQLQDIALYQMLAKDDPAMMELLNEYQAVPKM